MYYTYLTKTHSKKYKSSNFMKVSIVILDLLFLDKLKVKGEGNMIQFENAKKREVTPFRYDIVGSF